MFDRNTIDSDTPHSRVGWAIHIEGLGGEYTISNTTFAPAAIDVASIDEERDVLVFANSQAIDWGYCSPGQSPGETGRQRPVQSRLAQGGTAIPNGWRAPAVAAMDSSCSGQRVALGKARALS